MSRSLIVFAILGLPAAAGCQPQSSVTPTTPASGACAEEIESAPAAASGLGNCAKGWHAIGWPETNKSAYLTDLPKNCYVATGNSLQCFFVSAKDACDGIVLMNNTIEKNGTMYKSGTVIPGDKNSATCSLKIDDLTSQPTPLNYDPRPARSDDAIDTAGETFIATAVTGPYSQQNPSFVPKAGGSYNCQKITNENGKSESLRSLIVRVNKMGNNGVVTSDLAGYPYPKPANSPCAGTFDPNTNTCFEPTMLSETAGKPTSAQVHHIVPRSAKGPPACPWGKNSMANAAVISAQLNQVLFNKNRPADEVDILNKKTKYNTINLP